MKTRGFLIFLLPLSLNATTIVGWNNLGMHCMDSDYSVFSVLPPYNTIEAQLIVNGRLVTNGSGYTLTYQATPDPDGSFNSTAMGKGNYYTFAQALYGANLGPEAGLAGWFMPGVSNIPQSMLFEVTNRPAPGVATPVNWWRAEGIPISPYDDNQKKNPYPLMRIIARNAANQPIATNDVVLPVSDEMDCRACHASGGRDRAKPLAGWVWDSLPERDFRLNILRLHDQMQFANHPVLYAEALAARDFNPQGLYRGVVADGKPVLCAACHASEALGAPSYGSIPPLTAAVHSRHARVRDPDTGLRLDDAANRSACYRCHPGSATACLRGAMGGARAQDGSMSMQCQSCHGNMTAVGATNRVGWFMEPNCQSCHSGTATANNGQIRYTSVFETNGQERVAVNQTFATQPNTPAPGISLYRFSAGHGGLQCSACHGSTHAEFPSTHRNDNLRNIALQGHAGVMSECTACHTASPNTVTGGPHGMHPVGQAWLTDHNDALEHGLATRAQCQACHGVDYRGTVLSRMLADRTLYAFGIKTLFKGAVIGCYTCHNGPNTGDANPSAVPTVTTVVTNTTSAQPVSMTVAVAPVSAALWIVSQPSNGSAGVSNNVLTYFPNPGFTGQDTFTYAAYDGAKNSRLATGVVQVAQGPFSIAASARVPPAWPAGWVAPFFAFAAPSNIAASVSYDWSFGDGSPNGSAQYSSHTYAQAGTYQWQLVVQASTATETQQGTIVISAPISATLSTAQGMSSITWPWSYADAVLEETALLNPPVLWLPNTNTMQAEPAVFRVTLPDTPGNRFYRLRLVQ